MSPTLLAVVGIAVMLALMMVRVPIAFAMLATGMIGVILVIGPEASLQLVAADVYRQFSSYTMAVVPLFILMGLVIFHAGISSRLFATAYTWIGHLPGGVAATTILASVGFSAVSGSNAAATATMGSVALPEMKRYGYDPAVAGGAVAIGGTLGVLIPPSTALIIIAVQSEQSISTLFQAALLPGVLIGLLLVVTSVLICWRRPQLGPPGPRADLRTRLRSLGGVSETVILFAVALGGMFAGWFTPSEAAAVGAFGAIVIGIATRSLSIKGFQTAVSQTLHTSAMVVLLIAGAVVFGRFMAVTRLPFDLAEWAAGLAVPRVVVLLIVITIYLVGGALMDALGFLVISIPIFFPLITALGYDLVWFTIVVTLITTLGAVTPPVGVNVFIVSGLDKSLKVLTVFRGVAPYFVVYAVALAVCILVPEVITFSVD
ncbi:TRAP transporter large permease [Blastococcus sp. BMG 814]|uniref:TRAP transporter large permease n=1 Tax=Blastococcus carthaginiensis TaxID=3050034 RepID=A0ABT9IBN8_9ACTN|nr:TRAP transporter large permease [Blastococcus carthaginiensis]MDP5182545.1 TRAP transporter large permease [Blastococcus carthaginiensis]